jgi:alkanesulfonate monooxygenase SsuD/methylene tetrahydromethanopterin reductase-like flavin-dependent oxidoreductase (luciferase family)
MVPIWFGGHAEVTMQRVVKWGAGWMPHDYAPGDEAVAAFDKLRAMAEAAGRDPASIGIDTRTTVGIGGEAEWRETVRFWKSCGVTHLTLGTYSGPRAPVPHRWPEAGRPPRRHQALLERGHRSAVGAADRVVPRTASRPASAGARMFAMAGSRRGSV